MVPPINKHFELIVLVHTLLKFLTDKNILVYILTYYTVLI